MWIGLAVAVYVPRSRDLVCLSSRVGPCYVIIPFSPISYDRQSDAWIRKALATEI